MIRIAKPDHKNSYYLKMTKDEFEEIEAPLTPDKTIYEKLGQGQHQLGDAIAELIDNSFDARTDEQIEGKEKLLINIRVPLTKTLPTPTREEDYADYIEIEDNASGMMEDIAKTCLVLAKTSKSGNTHGRYGLGLKHSCLSIGQKFTIITKNIRSKYRYIITYDNETFKKSKSWDDFRIKKLRDDSNFYGTIIRIEDFWNPKLIRKETITKLKARLSFIHGPFIKEKLLDIFVNKDVLKYKELDLEDNKKIEIKEFMLPDTGKEIHIRGWLGFLKQGSTIGFAGFNLYRNGRLIKQFEKIGYRYHAELRKLVGDLHLDDFPVTTDKKDFNRDSYEWQLLVGEEKIDESGRLTGYIGGILDKKIKPYISEYRKKVEIERAVHKVDKDADRKLKEIQEREIRIKAIEQREKDKGEIKEALIGLSHKENKPSLKETEKSELHAKEQNSEKEKLLKDLEYETFIDKKELEFEGHKYRFDHKSEHAGIKKEWYRIDIKDKDRILIISNLDNQFIHDLKTDFDVYFNIHVLLGLSEALSLINKTDKTFVFNKVMQMYNEETDKKRKLESKKKEILLELREAKEMRENF